eukprot:759383-Hanusia_phi.AAC.1
MAVVSTGGEVLRAGREERLIGVGMIRSLQYASQLDWQIYRSAQIPGPVRMSCAMMLGGM